MTCKDCIHERVCFALIKSGLPYDDLLPAEAFCMAFKNKVAVVEVIRCKDCEHHHWEQEPCHGKTQHFCSVLKAQVFADFFCYHGTKRSVRGNENRKSETIT